MKSYPYLTNTVCSVPRVLFFAYYAYFCRKKMPRDFGLGLSVVELDEFKNDVCHRNFEAIFSNIQFLGEPKTSSRVETRREILSRWR